jgi:hypothetical protein
MVFVFRCKQLDFGYLGALLYDEGQKLLAAEVSGRLFMGMAQNPQAPDPASLVPETTTQTMFWDLFPSLLLGTSQTKWNC